ncbi:hypothetical protein HYPSUDRAFT_605907 [Hypholoma sublateritium FD-334 SS-4]|uniref:Uncharacterized protein n=1 Tax=Hypholoma sublateritium (strain FD-334 SS-4) TaxID=945553 RepID=A0A0D2LQB2_HYPSF|nr:hypothetical protein HYPSUDRAFT_605907 [Hypholoma sublateritium FD-334 SS-4]
MTNVPRWGAGCPVGRSRQIVLSPHYPVLSSPILLGPFRDLGFAGLRPHWNTGPSMAHTASVPAYPAANLLCQGRAATAAIKIPRTHGPWSLSSPRPGYFPD